MFHYRLRTLVILVAVGPPVLAWSWYAWEAGEVLAPIASRAAIAVSAASVLGVVTAGIMLLCFGGADR